MADHYEKRDEEDEEDEIGEQDYKAQKDALLLAIDVSSSMLQPPPESDDKKADKDPPVYAALKCAYQVMQQRIISNPKDMMGIILFGTEKTKYRDDQNLPYPHCYVYSDIDVPAAEDVKNLKSLVEEGEDADEILVPSSDGVEMSILFFLANNLLTTKAPNFGSRRLFIITDNDDPHSDNKLLKENAARRAKDLYDLGVTIELFAITRDDEKFDFSKFYDDIIYRDPAVEEAHPGRVSTSKSGSGLTLLNSLISNINSKETPKRSYFSNMSLELGPGLQISVKGYNIVQKQAAGRSCYVWLDGEKAQIAVGETARIAEDSARTVQTSEVKKAYKFGSEYVYFSEDEQKSIKQFGGPIIRIIGFKDRSQLGFWASIKKSTFIFPSEEGYVGSSRVFTALWQKLLKSKKIGLAWHIARANGNPQLVAIIPSKARSDHKSGIDFIPAGLWLYPVPFADDVREGPDQAKLIRTTDQLTDKMKKIVGNLQLPTGTYNPSKYPNPALQWHYKILQALALEEEVPNKPNDATIPKYKVIHNRCGGFIQEWSQTADDVLSMIRDAKAIKREMEDDGEDEEPRPAKRSRTKTSASGAEVNNAELKKRYKDGTLSKLTVAELKPILDERGIDARGLKKSLVERLEGWIEENMGIHVCVSVQEVQDRLYNLLTSKSSDTRAEHASFTFELRYNVVFNLNADAENDSAEGVVNPSQSQQLPVTRSVNASETVQNQPSDDPVLQQAVAKHIVSALGTIDSSSWMIRKVSKGAEGWTFTYMCRGSLEVWNRANAKKGEKPAIGSYSGPGGLDSAIASRPAFDCRGTLTIIFSKSARGVIVKYNHTPIHKTVAQLVGLIAPTKPPVPVNNGNGVSQRTPKAKRPPPTKGEEGSRKKRVNKGKAPEAPMGEPSIGEPSLGDGGSVQNDARSQAADQSDLLSTTVLNVLPDEVERRTQTALNLLKERSIDPTTLSDDQFNIFANQAPDLQAISLEMLAEHGAERLRIVHPHEKDVASPANSAPVEVQSTNGTPTPGPGPTPTPGTTETPTKKRRPRKTKPDGPATEVPIGDGAVVPVEKNGDVGTTTSTLKPVARRTRGSCEICKDRKAKCTKEHPSCSVCIEAGVECLYLPPKPRRRKSGISAEVVEPEDSDVPGEGERFETQIQAQETVPVSVAPVPVQHSAPNVVPPPLDPDNEEFIPDPNVLVGPVEHPSRTTQPPIQPPTATQYYQGNTSGLTFPQNPQPPSRHTEISTLTFPEPQTQRTESESSANLTFPLASHQIDRSSGLTFPQSAAPSSTKKTQNTPTSRRRSLPVSQSKQTPIPVPTSAIPQQTPSWNVSPKQQPSKRQRSLQNGIEQAAALPHAAIQATARAKSRQGHRSQTNTPVSSASRPPPQAPQTATNSSYNTNSSASIPNYNAYARYDNSTNGQYDNASRDQNTSHITYKPASYSSTQAFDYSRGTVSSNALSQALDSGYNNNNSPATTQWPTSQTRDNQSRAQTHTSNSYSMPSTTSTSHNYGTRASDTTTRQGSSYDQNQSQPYGSYTTSQANNNQQHQQPWYGFNTANTSAANQNSCNSNRNNGYSGATNSNHAAPYSGTRPNVPNYPGHSYGTGSDDQSLYDLLRASGSSH
ncbi:hypothetical protein F4677DRAFT_454504 [Hypoxylon crocopeplum]|nr:hypothetical protein F4677DRAFT_454504 [Hypoxylon crocopeplum]